MSGLMDLMPYINKHGHGTRALVRHTPIVCAIGLVLSEVVIKVLVRSS